ncbi:hypothetical protein PIB30_077146, partial [Stylosanthes scabra]|nr:hypothetical protein [Stylosanthes scabra]
NDNPLTWYYLESDTLVGVLRIERFAASSPFFIKVRHQPTYCQPTTSHHHPGFLHQPPPPTQSPSHLVVVATTLSEQGSAVPAQSQSMSEATTLPWIASPSQPSVVRRPPSFVVRHP